MVVRANIGVGIAPANLAFSRVRPVVVEASRQSPNFECIWSPLSLFKVEHAIPCSKGEIVLNPQTASEAQRRAIESCLGITSKVPNVDYNLVLVDMFFYR